MKGEGFALVVCVLLCGVCIVQGWRTTARVVPVTVRARERARGDRLRCSSSEALSPSLTQSQTQSQTQTHSHSPSLTHSHTQSPTHSQTDSQPTFLYEEVISHRRTQPFFDDEEEDDDERDRERQRGEVQETVTSLSAGVPVEFFAEGKLRFGNYLRKRETTSDDDTERETERDTHTHSRSLSACVVRLPSGRESVIDAAQIVSVWDDAHLALSAPLQSPADWAETLQQALALAQSLSPRERDLEEFWTLSLQRSAQLSVDSADLAVYLFQRRKFRRWIDPYAASETANVHALSPAQRYAAALLLAADDLHFKRRPSLLRWPEDAAEDALSLTPSLSQSLSSSLARSLSSSSSSAHGRGAPASPSALSAGQRLLRERERVRRRGMLHVTEGGYRPHDESTAHRLLCDFFAASASLSPTHTSTQTNAHIQARAPSFSPPSSSGGTHTHALSPFNARLYAKLLDALELFSLSPPRTRPQKLTRVLLKRMNAELSPRGAYELLARIRGTNTPTLSLTQTLSHSQRNLPTTTNNVSLSHAQTDTLTQTWTTDLLDAAKSVASSVEERRLSLAAEPVPRSLFQPRSHPRGQLDLRAFSSPHSAATHSNTHPPICIDSQRTSFFDDAISLSPETSEVLIHVTDVYGALSPSSTLSHTRSASSSSSSSLTSAAAMLLDSARARAQSRFFSPSLSPAKRPRPLHMLPPALLDALCLSSSRPNEVLTVALRIDFSTGEILGERVFSAVLAPVETLSVDAANEILAGVGVSLHREREGGPATEVSLNPRYSSSLVRDLRLLERVGDKLCARYPALDAHSSSSSSPLSLSLTDSQTSRKRKGKQHQGAFRMLDAFLSLFSQAAHRLCVSQRVPVPLVWDNRFAPLSRRVEEETTEKEEHNRNKRHRERNREIDVEKEREFPTVRRFATTPLRSFMSIAQQQQLRAALGMNPSLSRSECASAVRSHNARVKEMSCIAPLIKRDPAVLFYDFARDYEALLRARTEAIERENAASRDEEGSDKNEEANEQETTEESNKTDSEEAKRLERKRLLRKLTDKSSLPLFTVRGLGGGGALLVEPHGAKGLATNMRLQKDEIAQGRVVKLCKETNTVMMHVVKSEANEATEENRE